MHHQRCSPVGVYGGGGRGRREMGLPPFRKQVSVSEKNVVSYHQGLDALIDIFPSSMKLAVFI